MEWAFCPTGDPVLGIDLTIAAAPMLMHLSMSNENRRHVDRALAIAMTHQKVDVRREMELYAARGLTLVSTISSGHEVRAAFSRALEIAEQINDADYRLRALWSLCNATFNDGNYGAALDIARRFCAFAAASGDPGALEPREVLLGVSLHLTGRLGEGRSRLERLLATEYPADRPSLGRFLLNRRALALSVLAAVLWHLGFPDQAKQRAEEGLAEALSTNHALSICTTLGNSCCFVALSFAGHRGEQWCGHQDHRRRGDGSIRKTIRRGKRGHYHAEANRGFQQIASGPGHRIEDRYPSRPFDSRNLE
jgi:hypothetical protein